ncbi:hypothetical protein [Paenibacillus lignilyticus]|uniref:Uncharacterized protein n=1 Tax=Paenibacillus lignilyticus TaxID=1172615 RepID=A0ABS5CBH6_9BACL|nr:hypothetical protein [Paenibacillus lignilyticus]MBP3962810.1 hypothetical protein [Paenibacillus lignilyticus]
MALTRRYTLSDLKDEVYYFDNNWRRIFANGRAVCVATKNNASLGLAVHSPPHTTINL